MLDGALAAQLIEIGKTLYYKDRRWDAILQLASRVPFPIALDRFAAWLPTGEFDQKCADALEIIATICAHLATAVAPLSVSYRFMPTGYHQAMSPGQA